jgi:hypothetical protein
VGDWRVIERDGITFPLARPEARTGQSVYTKFAGN